MNMGSSATELVNPTPTVFTDGPFVGRSAAECANESDSDVEDPIDALEIYELLRNIRDPEHPNTLEQLRVMEPGNIVVAADRQHVRVNFTPTVPHCSMTTLIGLCIRLKLLRCLPLNMKVDVLVTPGSHNQEEQVNKQLNDKERVAAALENYNLVAVVESCLNEFD